MSRKLLGFHMEIERRSSMKCAADQQWSLCSLVQFVIAFRRTSIVPV